MDEHLTTGERRAVAHPPLLVVDAEERAARLQQALVDPDQAWLLQEFDGRSFRSCGEVRGPDGRAAFLAGQSPPEEPQQPGAGDPPHPPPHEEAQARVRRP